MYKKSDVWVSTVIYMALGLVLLTIILVAGMPIVDKMKDRNTVVQTKEIMYNIDNEIKTVVREGPGARRQINIELTKGNFIIDSQNDLIYWYMKTKALLASPDVDLYEGNVRMRLNKTLITDEYYINLYLNYADSVNIVYRNPRYTENPDFAMLSGKYALSILNNGTAVGAERVTVIIEER